MHYFIFPDKDATIYNDSVLKNTGFDQILEIRKVILTDDTKGISRSLIKFDLSTISASLADGEITGSVKYYLNLYVSDAEEIAVDYTIEAQALTVDWEQGSGKDVHTPVTTDGVSWRYTDGTDNTTYWNSPTNTTAGDGGAFTASLSASQDFSAQSADIVMDVTDMVNAWLSGSLSNYGMILKFPSGSEGNNLDYGTLRFFSSETHTIYRPRLEVVWDDSVWRPYSLSSSISQSFVTSSFTYNFSQSLGYTTSSFRVGESVFSGSYPSHSQVGSTNLYVSESYGQFAIIQQFTYDTSSGIYSSSSISYSTRDFIYVSGSSSIVSSSIISSASATLYTASLGSEFTASSPTLYINYETTSSDIFIKDEFGIYRSESYTENFRVDTYTSTSVSYSLTTISEASGTLFQPPGEQLVVALKGIQPEYRSDARVRFRLYPRERFPMKKFSNTWRYDSNNILPRSSSYSIRDAHTEFEVVPFSDYTKISTDSSGSFFDLWMNGYEQERYYRILIKVVKSGREDIYDNDYIFKVVR